MKKIAFLTPHYLPSALSGSGIVVMKLAKQFAKEGYDVSIITSSALTTRYWYDPIFGKSVKEKFSKIDTVKIYRLSCNQFFSSVLFAINKFFGSHIPKKWKEYVAIMSSGPYFQGLQEFLQSHRFDVIHVSPAPLAMNIQLVAACKKLTKKPKIIFTPFFHTHVKTFTNPKLKEVCNDVEEIHVISQAEKADMIQAFSLDIAKFHVIPLFLDTTGMHDIKSLSTDVATFKEKYGLENRKIVLFAGIKGKDKGAIDVMIAVDKMFRKDHRYILLALGSDTPEWTRVKKDIDERCLLDLGYKTGKEKEIIFSACDVFCMPSKSETFGMVYLEAWHKKKPVIAAQSNAVAELIGSDGLLVPYGDIPALIHAISFIDKKTLTLQMLGKKGYNALMKRYTFQKVFTRYRKLFMQA